MSARNHPLVAEWRREAEHYERRGQTSLAALARSFADDLEASERERSLECLTLSEAAQESGYSLPHLARLITERRIENAGETGAPRIRRGALPKKPPRAPLAGPDLPAPPRK